MKRFSQVILYIIGIFIMLSLIPSVSNDYILTGVYTVFISVVLLSKKERSDYTFLLLGFFGVILGEYFFIRTGVETFNRRTLFGIMPLWLPFLWSFIFLAMKRFFWILVRDYWHSQLK